MVAGPALLSAADAADYLRLSPRRVREMCAAGDLAAYRVGGVWVVPRSEVWRERVRAEFSPHSRGRPWSQARAWAVMRLLDGDDRAVSLLSAPVRSRMRGSPQSSGPKRLLAAVRDRAEPVPVAVHRSAVEELRGRVVTSGIQAAGIHGHGLTGAAAIDGYIDAAGFERLHELGVRPDDAGGHIFRVVDDGAVLEGLSVAPRLAVAADLLDHVIDPATGAPDGRVVGVAKALLEEVADG